MIEAIITYLNTILAATNLHEKNYGLTELITKGDVRSPRYNDCGDFKNVANISNYNGVSYWRLNNEQSISTDEDPLLCGKLLTFSIPLRLFSVVSKDKLEKNDAYSALSSSQIAVNALTVTTSTFASTLNARLFSVGVDSINSSPEDVFQSEFQGSKQALNFEKWAVSIVDFTITVEISEDCYRDLCNNPIDFLCETVSGANPNELADCIQALPEEEQNIICPPAVITDGEDTVNVPSGGSYTCSIGASIIYNRVQPTGQWTSFALYDEGWQVQNGAYTFAEQIGQLQRLDLSSSSYFLTLLINNAFGNKTRFTNDLGGSVVDGSDGSTASYLIDHLSGLGWYYFNSGVNENWTTALSTANSFSIGAYSGFRMPNINEYLSVISYQATDLGSAAQILRFRLPMSTTRLWTSTNVAANDYAVRNDQQIVFLNKGNLRPAMFCRTHYI